MHAQQQTGVDDDGDGRERNADVACGGRQARDRQAEHDGGDQVVGDGEHAEQVDGHGPSFAYAPASGNPPPFNPDNVDGHGAQGALIYLRAVFSIDIVHPCLNP